MKATSEDLHSDFNPRTNHLIDLLNGHLTNLGAEHDPRYSAIKKNASKKEVTDWQRYLDRIKDEFSRDEVIGIVKHKIYLSQALIDYLSGDNELSLRSFKQAYSYERGSSFEYYEEIYHDLGGILPKKSSYHSLPHNSYELNKALLNRHGRVVWYRHFTIAIPYMFESHFSEWTEDEIEKYTWLRAIEWLAFPAFISAGIGAWLLLIMNPVYAIVVIGTSNFIWSYLAVRFTSLRLAGIGVLINKLKFITSPVLLIYFIVHQNYILGIIAFF